MKLDTLIEGFAEIEQLDERVETITLPSNEYYKLVRDIKRNNRNYLDYINKEKGTVGLLFGAVVKIEGKYVILYGDKSIRTFYHSRWCSNEVFNQERLNKYRFISSS